MAIKQSTRALRLASAAFASLGVLINLITSVVLSSTTHWGAPEVLSAWAFLPLVLTIAGNHAILNPERVFKHGIPTSVLIITDGCGFLGFLALLITNGLILNRLSLTHTGHMDKMQMLMYNAMPWVLCGGIHLMLTLQAAVDTFEIMMPTRETRCADCKRVIGQGQGKSTDDGVSRSLLRPDYGSEDDGDFNA